MANPETNQKKKDQWQYKRVYESEGHLSFLDILNELGREGWEAYAHLKTSGNDGVVYLKRRIQGIW